MLKTSKLYTIAVSLLIVISIFAGTTFSVNATGEGSPIIIVQNVNGYSGKTVDVSIDFKNNPGITSAKLLINFPDDLTLTGVTFGDIGGTTLTSPSFNSPLILNWYVGNSNFEILDFTFATLTFSISGTTETVFKDVTVQYCQDDIFNLDNDNVEFAKQDGGILVFDHIPGDINDDAYVNGMDISALVKYLINEEVNVNDKALDVNGDLDVSVKDLVRLYKHLYGLEAEIY